MKSTKVSTKAITDALNDPQIKDLLKNEVVKPIVLAMQDPESPLRAFLSTLAIWAEEVGPQFQRSNEAMQNAAARADDLLEKMQSISLKEFLQLDSIDPYTLLFEVPSIFRLPSGEFHAACFS
jgi:hypothetical protein